MLQVVVVGGGPAGLIAAETLALAGVSVTLLESHPQRLLPCAGLLTPQAVKALGAPELLVTERVAEMNLVSPSQRVAYISLGGPERSTGVMRRDMLHAHLRRRAEEAGVVIRHALFRRFLHGDGDYPLLEISPIGGSARERISADVVIAADGVHSRVARVLGLPPLELGITYLEYLTWAEGYRRPADAIHVHMSRKLAPERFAWMLPGDERWVLGISTHSRYGRRVRELAGRLRNRLGAQIKGAQVTGRGAYFFPWRNNPRFAHDRVLFVGDAAGIASQTSFDGLYFAAVTGRLAAEVVAEHQHMPTTDRLADYRRRFDERYGEFLGDMADLDAKFLASDKRREILLDLAYERDLQQATISAYFEKRALKLPLLLKLKARFRVFASQVKQAWSTPKREQQQLAKVLPTSDNYLDFALSQGNTGPLRRGAESVLPDRPIATTPREEN